MSNKWSLWANHRWTLVCSWAELRCGEKRRSRSWGEGYCCDGAALGVGRGQRRMRSHSVGDGGDCELHQTTQPSGSDWAGSVAPQSQISRSRWRPAPHAAGQSRAPSSQDHGGSPPISVCSQGINRLRMSWLGCLWFVFTIYHTDGPHTHIDRHT